MHKLEALASLNPVYAPAIIIEVRVSGWWELSITPSSYDSVHGG